jgi:hypothetical protein
MTNRWLMFNFDVLGAFAVLVTTLFSLSRYSSAGIVNTPVVCVVYVLTVISKAGVCISSAISWTTSIYWACRFVTTRSAHCLGLIALTLPGFGPH